MTKPIIWNALAFYLQPKAIMINTVQAQTELRPQYLYKLNASDYLPSELIPLAVDHKINHKFPKLLNIVILSTAHSRVYI